MKSIQQLSSYVFFIDRNFGRRLVPDALRAAGLALEVNHEHFPVHDVEPELSDIEWIETVTSRGWVILTRNGSIRRNPLERRAFIRAGARVFNIRNASADAQRVASAIRKAGRSIATILEQESPPFIAGISMNGDVTFIDRPEAER